MLNLSIDFQLLYAILRSQGGISTECGKVVPVLKQAPIHKEVWGSKGRAVPRIPTSTPDGGE
jgi:hypothetical protein